MEKQILITSPSSTIVKELRHACNFFKMKTPSVFIGEGLYKRAMNGNHGHVKLSIETAFFVQDVHLDTILSFDIGEENIPSEFHSKISDVIDSFSLIYHVVQSDTYITNIRILGGSNHIIDSRGRDFEIATYLALKNAFE